jgi:hypothetical protein
MGNASTTILPVSYIGLSLGGSDLSTSNSSFGIFPADNLGHVTHIAVGNYGPQQNLGVEAGYTNFGAVNRQGGTTRAEGINLSLIGRFPVSDMVNLLGKVGTTYGKTDVSASLASGAATGSAEGFDWSYGIGAEVILAPTVSAVLQYDEHFIKFAGDHSNRVNATTVGLRYRF